MKTIIFATLISITCLAWSQPLPKEILAAREIIKLELKDPDSVKYKEEMVFGTVVCGQANAKNSYGGYSGFNRFMVDNEVVIFEDKKYPFFSRWWNEHCKN
jgi:hypothetical protein